MDWSLMQRNSHYRFLRKELIYTNHLWVSPSDFIYTQTKLTHIVGLLLRLTYKPLDPVWMGHLCARSWSASKCKRRNTSSSRSSSPVPMEFLSIGERTFG
jgi:hypothetical protein